MFNHRKRSNQGTKLNSYSYYRSNSSDTSTQPKRGLSRLLRGLRPRFSVFRLLITLASLTIVALLLYVDTNPIIRFASTGVNPRDTEIYRSGAQKIISSSVFNRTKLTFDYRGVEEDLKVRFPEIETIRITFDVIGRRPVVQVLIHEPTYLFRTNGVSWAIDDRGVAIGRRDDLKESFTSTLKTINDELGVSVDTGEAVIAPSQVIFLSTLIQLLEKQQAIIEAIYLPVSPKQIDIVLRDEGWRYKINLEGEAALQAGTVLAARATLKSNGNTPIEYVDIRVPEKVFWK